MLDYGFYNMDCMSGMRQFPDKFFDLAIVDPPYGLGEQNLKKNRSRGCLTVAKSYHSFAGLDNAPPQLLITSKSCSG